jgi:hypothetical protein
MSNFSHLFVVHSPGLNFAVIVTFPHEGTTRYPNSYLKFLDCNENPGTIGYFDDICSAYESATNRFK